MSDRIGSPLTFTKHLNTYDQAQNLDSFLVYYCRYSSSSTYLINPTELWNRWISSTPHRLFSFNHPWFTLMKNQKADIQTKLWSIQLPSKGLTLRKTHVGRIRPPLWPTLALTTALLYDHNASEQHTNSSSHHRLHTQIRHHVYSTVVSFELRVWFVIDDDLVNLTKSLSRSDG